MMNPNGIQRLVADLGDSDHDFPARTSGPFFDARHAAFPAQHVPANGDAESLSLPQMGETRNPTSLCSYQNSPPCGTLLSKFNGRLPQRSCGGVACGATGS